MAGQVKSLEFRARANPPGNKVQLSPERALPVGRTRSWSLRCEKSFAWILRDQRRDGPDRPRLFGVIQGARDIGRRERCAARLLDTDFDGYGFRCGPLAAGGITLIEFLKFVRELVPAEPPLPRLGVGHPVSRPCHKRHFIRQVTDLAGPGIRG